MTVLWLMIPFVGICIGFTYIGRLAELTRLRNLSTPKIIKSQPDYNGRKFRV